MQKNELLSLIDQCGYDLFNLESSSDALAGLGDIGIRTRKTSDPSTPYEVYFALSLYKLNTTLGICNAERLRDEGQYFLPPNNILDGMPYLDIEAGTIEVSEQELNSTKIMFEQVGHAVAFITAFAKNC